MSKFKIDVNELNKAVYYIEEVKARLQNCAERIFNASYSIVDQTSAKIDSGKNRSNQAAVNIKRQIDNLSSIQECIRCLMREENNAVSDIKNIFESLDLNTKLKTGAEVVSVVATTGNIAGIGSESGENQVTGSYERVMYYNLVTYGENDPRGDDTFSSCYISSYAMLLRAKGENVTPGDLYVENGNSNYCSQNSYAGHNLIRTSISGSADEKYQQILAALQQHPEGLVIGHETSATDRHAVYIYLDDNGQIKINDPGQVWPSTNFYGGEGLTDINQTYNITSWNRITFIHTFE